MKVIYFNQWFSSIANVIDDMKSKHSVRIIASSKTPEHVYRYSVDEFFVEDWEELKDDVKTSMSNYVEWVLNLCKKEQVELFFVKKHAIHIMENAEKFEEIGVTLISEDYETLKRMESKASIYRMLSSSGNDDILRFIPLYHIFENPENAIRYVESHRGQNNICLKFDKDEGGASFRAIRDKWPEWKDLYFYDVNRLTSDEACQLITASGNNVSRLLFMEILDSPEISIDCYNSKKGFIALARMKVAGRKQKLFYNHELANMCKQMGQVLNLKFPYNVQFRVLSGGNVSNTNDLRLLEINPRMSGGLYYEVLCGKNIAEICMLDHLDTACDYDVTSFSNFEDKYITHVEKAVLLND